MLDSITSGIDEPNHTEERGHGEILNRSNFPDENFINARMIPDKSIFFEQNTNPVLQNDFNDLELQRAGFINKKSYPMMIKLIDGSLNGVQHWNPAHNNNRASSGNDLQFPTIASVANEAAEEDGTPLDSKQLIAYETICATFLLGLINDGDDDCTSLGSYFANAVASCSSKHHNGDSEASISSKDEIFSTTSDCSFQAEDNNSDRSETILHDSSPLDFPSSTNSEDSLKSQQSMMSISASGSYEDSLQSIVSDYDPSFSNHFDKDDCSTRSIESCKNPPTNISVSTYYTDEHSPLFTSSVSNYYENDRSISTMETTCSFQNLQSNMSASSYYDNDHSLTSGSLTSNRHENEDFIGLHNLPYPLQYEDPETTCNSASPSTNEFHFTEHNHKKFKDVVKDKLYALGQKNSYLCF